MFNSKAPHTSTQLELLTPSSVLSIITPLLIIFIISAPYSVKNKVKYTTDSFSPRPENGASTGLAPTHVNKTTVDSSTQTIVFFFGENLAALLPFFTIKINEIKIEAAIATTPPNLDGTARKIA